MIVIIDKTHVPLLVEMSKKIFSKSEQLTDSFLETILSSSNYIGFIDEDNFAFALFSYILDEAEIITVGVLPQCQGKGFAKGILKSSFNHLYKNGIKNVFAEFRVSNKIAESLYKSLGCEVIGTRKNYYNLPTEDSVNIKFNLKK